MAQAYEGLSLFAAAWAERWIANGGCVIVNATGEASIIGVASASDVPGYEPPPADWPEGRRLHRIEFDDAMLCGRQREMLALLAAVPGGRGAVKDYVRHYPTHARRDGSRELC